MKTHDMYYVVSIFQYLHNNKNIFMKYTHIIHTYECIIVQAIIIIIIIVIKTRLIQHGSK